MKTNNKNTYNTDITDDDLDALGDKIQNERTSQ